MVYAVIVEMEKVETIIPNEKNIFIFYYNIISIIYTGINYYFPSNTIIKKY